jgi:hypothetical protein
MTEQRIVYENNEGGVSVIVPAPDYLESNSIETLANKDVPTGKPYWIIDVSELPEDREFRNAWTLDSSIGEPDGVGA